MNLTDKSLQLLSELENRYINESLNAKKAPSKNPYNKDQFFDKSVVEKFIENEPENIQTIQIDFLTEFGVSIKPSEKGIEVKRIKNFDELERMIDEMEYR